MYSVVSANPKGVIMQVPTIVSSTTIESNLPFWGTFVDTDVSFNNPTTGFFTVQNGTGLHIGSGVVIFAAHTFFDSRFTT